MSRFILGDCVRVMATFPGNAVDFILTDPPYLVGFRDRSGRTIAGDKTDEWLQPACNEMYRVLKKDALMVSFYGWNRVDRFMAAWKNAGFSVVGHLVFTKNYTSKAAYPDWRPADYRAEDRAERLALLACLLAVIPALNLASSDAAAVAGLVMTVLTVGLVSCAGKSLPRFWPGDFFPVFYACHLAVLGVLAL
ncbi:TraX family protein [Escherichia coli]